MRQKGFTLIELVVVIVILGILAATALPRFVNLAGDARGAARSGLQGAVASAANLAYGTAAARGQTVGVGAISMGGVNVTLDHGYPTANAAGIGSALQDTGGATYDNAGTWTLQTNCTVTYTAPVADGGVAVVAGATSGCSN